MVRLVGDVAAGHVIYTDNFYTSPLFATSLCEKQVSLVGAILHNRQGFPPLLRADIKQFETWAERGTTRYVIRATFPAMERQAMRIPVFKHTPWPPARHGY